MLKQALTLALAAFATACGAASQRPALTADSNVCPSGSVRGDAELERYASCTRVSGDLIVEDVTSLGALSELRRVDGVLRIQGTDRLYSLEGLDNLENVRELSLDKNRALINAGGLNGVARVNAVTITGNPRLTKSFGILNGLRERPSRLTITANAGLDAEGLRTVATERRIAVR
ncbi:MAG TPA: hypothetical protein VGK73_15520 [Polyangiaceae bacterium]